MGAIVGAIISILASTVFAPEPPKPPEPVAPPPPPPLPEEAPEEPEGALDLEAAKLRAQKRRRAEATKTLVGVDEEESTKKTLLGS